jgi:hypothetical protein
MRLVTGAIAVLLLGGVAVAAPPLEKHWSAPGDGRVLRRIAVRHDVRAFERLARP